MADIVMACIIMAQAPFSSYLLTARAYIVMARIDMAYIIMARIVMAYAVMACIVMACVVMA